MTELFSNLGQTNINQIGGIGSTDTTVVVGSLNNFPSSGNFRVIFGTDANSEIALCTAVNTTNNTFTILRGQEGSTAQSWSNGTTVTITVTAQAVNQSLAEVFQVGPYANRPAFGRPTGSYYQCTDGNAFVWDSGIGAWRPDIDNVLGYQPPAATTWTGVNQGTSTIADSAGSLIINGVSEVGFQLRMYSTSLASPGFAEACFTVNTPTAQGASQFAHAFIGFRESSSSKVFVSALLLDAVSNGLTGYMVMEYFSNNTTRTAFSATNISGDPNGPLFLRARRDATTVYSDFSRDGQNWVNFGSVATSTAFTTAPDQIVIGTTSDQTGAVKTITRFLSLRYGQFLSSSPLNIAIPGHAPSILQPPPLPPAPPPHSGWISSIINH
jgi:hypothetical protein